MKRVLLLTTIIMFLLMASGCSEHMTFYETVAVPFSESNMEELGLDEVQYNHKFENLQTFKNENGNKVMYLYSAPVEKSYNNIVDDSDYYQAQGTYFGKSFPKIISENTPALIGNDFNYAKIHLGDKSVEGRLVNCKNSFGLEKQAVIYKNAFGKGNDYICYPTSFGMNTEIKVARKTNTNKFQIKLQMPELTPDTNSPDYILFRTSLEKGAIKSILYTPIVSDANGKWSYANSVRLIDKDTEYNTYTVEYEIDQEFLNEEDTKFPVTLNQSIYLYKPKQPDTSAYEKTGDEAMHYLSPYILLGDSTQKGEGWTYIRYETLEEMDIDPEQIVSAKYVFHNLFDLDKEVKISAYAVTADWCSKNTRWFNRPPYDKRAVGSTVIKDAGDYSIDITSLVKEMLRNKQQESAIYSIENSFYIKSETNNSNICISSGDNGLFSPYMEIVISE